MPIQTSDLMMRLQPLTPIPAFGGGNGQLDMERQRLQLMQQEFENTKQNQEQDRALKQAAESARMAHEKAMQDRQLQNDAAARALEQQKAAAEVEKQKQEALGKFTELNGKGHIQEARAMVPLLTRMGLDVSLEGEDHGLPRYRIGPDPEAAARAQGQIGYPTDDSGTMSPPVSDVPAAREVGTEAERQALTDPNSGASPSPTEPFFQQALAASAQSAQTGLPTRGPDAPDYTGAVPKNVIDTGAQQQETLALLNPALKGFVNSYPSEWQGSAASTAAGVAGLGLPATESLDMLAKLRAAPDAAIKEGMTSDTAAAGRALTAADSARTAAHADHEMGFEKMGKEAAEKAGVAKFVQNRTAINDARFTLNNKTPTDDYLAASTIARLMGDNRVSNEDVQRVLGKDSSSFFQRLEMKAFEEAIGGLSDPQRKGLLGVLDKVEAEDRKRAFAFMDNVYGLASAPSTNPDVARGLNDYVKAVIPSDIRDLYQKQKPPSQASPPAAQKPFNMIEDSQAPSEPEGQGVLTNDPRGWKSQAADAAKQAGLDPKALQGVIQVESGGNPAVPNAGGSGATGLIQFMPEIAQGMGTSTEALSKMTTAQQLPYVIKYLKDRGLTGASTQDQMYVAIAAGGKAKDGTYIWQKPDSYVVYPKGSKEWKANKPWWPADGGDITVGSIKAFGGGGSKPVTLASAGTDAGARLREMRARLGE